MCEVSCGHGQPEAVPEPLPRLLAGCSHRNSGETVLLLQMPVSLSKGLWARSFVLYIHYTATITLYMFLLSYPYY